MNNDSKKKAGILRNNAFQTIIASLLCIVIGLLIGYVALLIINPKGAAGAITAILKNYFYYPSPVSYTHLDVYKRQEMYGCQAHDRFGSMQHSRSFFAGYHRYKVCLNHKK